MRFFLNISADLHCPNYYWLASLTTFLQSPPISPRQHNPFKQKSLIIISLLCTVSRNSILPFLVIIITNINITIQRRVKKKTHTQKNKNTKKSFSFVRLLDKLQKIVFNIPLVLSFPFYGINIITFGKKKV